MTICENREPDRKLKTGSNRFRFRFDSGSGSVFRLKCTSLEEKVAGDYDQADLKYWGPSTHINSPVVKAMLWCMQQFVYVLKNPKQRLNLQLMNKQVPPHDIRYKRFL